MGGCEGFGGFADQAPSAEELLRKEYPDLMDKWNEYQKNEETFRTIWNELENFTLMERLLKSSSYIHVFEKWIKARNEHIEAKEEYEFLEKLVRAY